MSGLRFGSLGLIIIGTQLHANSAYLGPAIVFSLIDLIVVLFLAVEIGRHTIRATASPPAKPQRTSPPESRTEHPGTAPTPACLDRPVHDYDATLVRDLTVGASHRFEPRLPAA